MFNETYSNTNGSSSVEEAYKQAFLPISFPDDEEQEEDGPEPPEHEPSEFEKMIFEAVEIKHDPAPKDNDNKPARKRDSCKVVEEGYFVRDGQLFYTKASKKNAENILVSREIRVTALVRDHESESWCKLLEWKDADTKEHSWVMPAELLVETTNPKYVRALASNGFDVFNVPLLTRYIKEQNPQSRMTCVSKFGWHDGNYVLPSGATGKENAELIILHGGTKTNLYTSVGDFESWKDLISFAQSNSRLVFALSIAFAGPLLLPANQESGGFNIVGESSTGKSISLRLAASVWGGSEHFRSWRTTDNAAEGMALLHNDNILILDELGQAKADAASEMAYMITNGRGKARAACDGSSRPVTTWRVMMLSSGEIGLAAKMAEKGKRVMAGQQVRMIDVPACPDGGAGIFEETHGLPPRDLAKKIEIEAFKNCGHAGRVYLQYLIDNPDCLSGIQFKIENFVNSVCPPNTNGQVTRVAAKFGFVAIAGQLAVEAQILPFDIEEPLISAKKCFEAWLDQRGSVDAAEEEAVLSHTLAYFIEYGHSRFQAGGQSNINNRMGFRVSQNDSTHYYVMRETWEKIFAGFDPLAVAKILDKHGFLIKGEERRLMHRATFPDVGRRLFYHVVFKNE